MWGLWLALGALGAFSAFQAGIYIKGRIDGAGAFKERLEGKVVSSDKSKEKQRKKAVAKGEKIIESIDPGNHEEAAEDVLRLYDK